MVSLEIGLIKKNRMLCHFSKWLLFPSSCQKLKGILLQYSLENQDSFLPWHWFLWRFCLQVSALVKFWFSVSACLCLPCFGWQFALWSHFCHGSKKSYWFFCLFVQLFTCWDGVMMSKLLTCWSRNWKFSLSFSKKSFLDIEFLVDFLPPPPATSTLNMSPPCLMAPWFVTGNQMLPLLWITCIWRDMMSAFFLADFKILPFFWLLTIWQCVYA